MGLELRENPRIQWKIWKLQRAGRWGIGAIVALAAIGLLGPGPLSTAEKSSPGGALRLEYDRYLNLLAPTVLRVQVAQSAIRGQELRLHLNRGFTEKMQIKAITPRPEHEELGGEDVVFSFKVASPEATAISFDLEPEVPGRHEGNFKLEGESVEFSQLVYP